MANLVLENNRFINFVKFITFTQEILKGANGKQQLTEIET